MVAGHQHVVLLTGGVELLDRGVDAVDRVAEPQALDRGRAHLADGLGGDRADHRDPHPVALDDRVRVVDQLAGALIEDVRGEIREVRARRDAVQQVVEALVVLVVPDRGGIDTHRIHHVDGGLVVLDGGSEGGAADVVPGGEEEGAIGLGAHRLDGADHAGGATEGAVEVVEGHQADLVVGFSSGGSTDRHHGRCEGDRGSAEADAHTAPDAARGVVHHECSWGQGGG
ncbi:hypothetical protein [Brachybacterium avium]|uniref:hypothetical protein n=1 Tax=Brachybacterium avium TaxID=2017485 RepID=UPI001FE65FF2|nr:hypothetical protein [Brachybacterium avium]